MTRKQTSAKVSKLDGVERVGPPLPGNKPVLGVTVFRGRVFAANEDGIYYLANADWKRLELEPAS